VQTRRPRCAQHGDGTVDNRVLLAPRTRLPGNTPSTGCVQKKVLACEAVHNGRKLSTLGISRRTLHVQLTPPEWRLAEQSPGKLRKPTRGRGWARGGPSCAVRAPARLWANRATPASWSGRTGTQRAQRGPAGCGPGGPLEPAWAADPAPNGMRAFAGRALAGLSNIRACVRRTGDSSAGSAGLSTSSLPARPAQMMRPEGRRPPRARTARLRGEPRAGRDRTTLTSPGWPRSGKWSLTPIPNSRNVCLATYPQPNNRL
jgi:hypothetical protein